MNSTSETDARIVMVRSRMVSTLIAGGMRAVSDGSCACDLVDSVDDVGAWLLEDSQHDAFAVVLIGNDGAIDRCANGLSDIANPDWGAIAIGDDDVVEFGRVGDLVVGCNGKGDDVAIDHALGGVGRRVDQNAADLFERQVVGGEFGRVDLNADRRRLIAEDGDLRYAGDLRNLLCQIDIGVIVNIGDRNSVRMHRQNHDRRVRWVDLFIRWRRGQSLRQLLGRHSDCRLHVL